MRTRLSILAASVVAGAVALGSVQANAAVIIKDNTTVVSIPGIATFQTRGDSMSGMTVTAFFLSGFSETVAWVTTGVGAGGAFGTSWSLTEFSDTFTSNWSFRNLRDSGLIQLDLGGALGFTLFDTTLPSSGTPGSALGRDFISNLALDALIIATYSDEVQIGILAPIGDLYQTLSVDFRLARLQGLSSFTFRQDTDNDARRPRPIPEPASLTIFGLGLAGLGFLLRRRRRTA